MDVEEMDELSEKSGRKTQQHPHSGIICRHRQTLCDCGRGGGRRGQNRSSPATAVAASFLNTILTT